jgi:hypothetical protein
MSNHALNKHGNPTGSRLFFFRADPRTRVFVMRASSKRSCDLDAFRSFLTLS